MKLYRFVDFLAKVESSLQGVSLKKNNELNHNASLFCKNRERVRVRESVA
jgi:hypothetical protein